MLTQVLTHQPNLAAYLEPFVHWFSPYWQADRYLGRVEEVREELAGFFSLVIRPTKRWPSFQAGQHVEIQVLHQGARTKRYFSISSSPAYYQKTGLIELSIRVQDKGRITPWLKQHYGLGGSGFHGCISLAKAQGQFVLPQGSQPLLLIAGGSGITPFRSMLQQLQLTQQNRDVQLLYFAKEANQHAFQTELTTISQQLPNVRVQFLSDSEHGWLSAGLLEGFCADIKQRQIYLCGPAPMLAVGQDALEQLGIASTQIHFERFQALPISQPKTANAAGQAVQINFSRSQQVVEFDPSQPSSLLEVAEQAGLKPLSGCRAGVCHQCVCKKVSGVVYNARTGEYSDSGAGEVQLCVSVATSDLVLEV